MPKALILKKPRQEGRFQMQRQFAIIKKIKNLVSQTGRKIIYRKNKGKDTDISEKIAQKIQKASYDFSLKIRKDSFTPPYQKLAEQLQVEESQIFRAAVYNMANIAMHRRKFKKEILNIFYECLNDNNLSNEKKEYIKTKIAKINQNKE